MSVVQSVTVFSNDVKVDPQAILPPLKSVADPDLSSVVREFLLHDSIRCDLTHASEAERRDLLANRHRLKSLCLCKSNDVLTSTKAAALVPYLTSVDDLCLHDSSVDDAALEAFSALQGVKNLWLSRTRITNAAAQVLCKFKALESLGLERAEDDGLSDDKIFEMYCAHPTLKNVNSLSPLQLLMERFAIDLITMTPSHLSTHINKLAKLHKKLAPDLKSLDIVVRSFMVKFLESKESNFMAKEGAVGLTLRCLFSNKMINFNVFPFWLLPQLVAI